MRCSLRLGLVLLLSLAMLPQLFAQKTTGTVTGTVTDSSGAIMPGATVTITSPQTGATRSATTNSQGSFSFPDMEPGSYDVTVNKQGFKQVSNKGVALHVGDVTNLNLQLPVGANTEVVEVQTSSVNVETQTGTVGNVVNGQEVRELPLNGRNFVQLTTLMPGVATAENFDAKNKGLLAGVDISFSGAPANANQWRVDGANNNDIGSQRTILIYPSVDAIEEFKILRNSYGPEYGGAGGAQINIVTRGGGNDFHGSAYYFGRNDALNAKNYLLGPTDHKQLLRRNDYGYTIGGPIKKDKLFFFWSEEWNKEKRARVRSVQLPTAAERTGDFRDMAACPSQIPQDPFNAGAPFTFNGQTNVIDPARISPAGSAYLSQLPLPNRADPCTANWVQGVTIPVDWREENIRGDINITKNNVLTLRYTQDAWQNPLHSDAEGGLWGEQASPLVSDSWNQPGKVAIAKLTSTLGSSAVNDFSFSWSANRITLALSGDQPALNDTIKGVFPTVFPQTDKLHGAGTAEPLCWCASPSGFIGHFGPWANGQDLFTWKDDFSKLVGKHTFKTGVYYSKNKKDEETGNDNGGLWGPASGHGNAQWNGTTNNEYSDFLVKGINWGYGENQTNGQAQARWSDLEFYFGDSWKVKPRLTLEYGARWSFTPPVYDARGNYSSFRPELYDPALGGAECNGLVLAKGTTLTCPAGTGGTIASNRSLAPSNYHLIAPRLGFAWDVFGDGKFALRGGLGQFYSRDPVGILVRVESNNAPEAVAPGGERQLDFVGGAPVLFDWVASGQPKQSIENNTNVANSWQWNLTTETELWKNAKLELGWVALRGIHLNSSASLNQVKPSDRLTYITNGFLGIDQKHLLPYPALPAEIQWNHRGDSIYHSLQSMFSTKVGRNSQFHASYTWSKNISDTTLAYVDTTTGIADRYNPRVGRGNADFDRRHVFNAAFVYNLPTMQGSNGFVRGVLGNWETSTIVNLFSGTGLKPSGTISGNWIDPATGISYPFSGNPWGIGNSASASAAPNRDFSQPCRATGTNSRTQWINPLAYTWNNFTLGGYPNAGPGVCAGPGVQDVDFSVSKNWNLPFGGNKYFGEKSRIQFRLETFNLLNHPMFRNTDLNYTVSGVSIVNNVVQCTGTCQISNNTNFGQAKTPSNIGNREIQYALKLIF